MKSVFDIYKQRGIPHNIVLKEFLDEYFHFLPSLDPSILDQMTAEQICTHQEFWNNESYMPIKFLLENNKVSSDGFKHIMRTEYYYTNSTDEKMDKMYQKLEDYISIHNVDITDYFKDDYIHQQMEDILRFKRFINTDVYLQNLDLEKALENSDSIAVLLFGFRDNDLPLRRAKMLEYICDNFELISKKFLSGKTSYKVSPSIYIHDNCEFMSRPLFLVAEYIDEKYGILDKKFYNKDLISEYVSGLLKNNKYCKVKELIEIVKEDFPTLYNETIHNKDYKSYFTAPKTLKLEGLTVEELHAFLENCTETDRHIVVSDLKYYIEVNKTGFNYDYSLNKFFTEYTKDFLHYQLDESIRLYNLKKELAEIGEKEPITSHWRWDGFTQTILRDIIHFNTKSEDNWNCVIEKALSCEMYQKMLVWYVEANGSLEIMNYINKYQPHLINEMNHDKLIHKIIVNEYNKKVFGNY